MDIKVIKQEARRLTPKGKNSFILPTCVVIVLLLICTFNPYGTTMLLLYGHPVAQFLSFRPSALLVYALLLFLASLFSLSRFSALLAAIDLIDEETSEAKWTDGLYVFRYQVKRAIIGMKIARFFRLLPGYTLISIVYGISAFLFFSSLFSGDGQFVLLMFWAGILATFLSSFFLMFIEIDYCLVDILFYLKDQKPGLEGSNHIFQESKKRMKGHRLDKWKLDLSFLPQKILGLVLFAMLLSLSFNLMSPSLHFPLTSLAVVQLLLVVLLIFLSFILWQNTFTQQTLSTILFAREVLKEEMVKEQQSASASEEPL